MPPAAPIDLPALHQRNNRESADFWERYGAHRTRVTDLAASAFEAGGRLALLGAGNCNDVDLSALGARAAEIHLVDLDGEALARARDRQTPAVAARLRLHAPIDLSGAFDRLPAFARRPASPLDLATLPGAAADAVTRALPETFDAVVSTCFLSQLMQSVFAALGPKHPQLHLIACALAVAHVRSVARLLRPGAVAHLVTDAVTSETYPLEELWGRQPPQRLLEELERAGNVFSGTGPLFLRRLLTTDREVGPRLAGPARLSEPWLWRFSDERVYLVYALSFTRAG